MHKAKENIEIPNDYIADVFGVFNKYAKMIEKELEVIFTTKEDKIQIAGEKTQVQQAKKVLEQQVTLLNQGGQVDEQSVRYALDRVQKSVDDEDFDVAHQEHVLLTYLGKPIKVKTRGQAHYISQIKKNRVVFGVGPAGTGKTYLAMAMAVHAFRKHEVSKIILTRPAIEAGEKLGFLPGDLQSKVDPYLRPLYDALFEMMGPESFEKNMEKGLIEVAPLAYMRGRTLNNAFVVLDEAQNTTPQQMKMFLTRLGFNSRTVITGDLSQVDLPSYQKSGLSHSMAILQEVEGIGFSRLGREDVVRHPLVQKIVEAYDAFEAKEQKRD